MRETRRVLKDSQHRARGANLVALAVIVAAGLLSTAWVFIVPIFQATDEAAHFDYAISIMSTGRLIHTSGAQTAWIVSPYTRYLLGATDYFRIAFHSSMRAPRGYGTLAYYRRIDSGAPSVRSADPPSRISYIAPAYPFGFYALEAIWMKTIAALTGSLVAVFFGARMLCVFLTMLGLYFSYRAALNVGVGPWVAVALLGGVAFFPLTTLVSSYVQPDNLGFALVAASLFFATELRRSKTPLPSTAVLGICLGLLAVTKYHFFVSAAIPIALLVIAQLWCERPKWPAAAARLLAFAIPACVLLGVQLAIAAPNYTQARGSAPPTGPLGPFFDALHGGAWPTIDYLAGNSVKAFVDFFATGPNAATYWGALGLWDTPIVIVNEQVELALRAIIALTSITVAATIAYRLLRNASRLLRVTSAGRPARAALIATSDPILSSYALFVCLMFGLYVVSDNTFGAAGRQWYPYIFAAFMCAVWYAPRTFARLRRPGPVVAGAAVAVYALAASGYATAAVLHRYYDKQSAPNAAVVPLPADIVPGEAMGFLWPVQGMDFHPLAERTFRDTFDFGSRLWAGGSAIFPSMHRAASSVSVVVDGRLAAPTIARQYNFQLAEATHDLTYGYSGFFGAFGTTGLPEGVHVVRAYAKIPETDRFQEILPARLFFLANGAEFSDAFLNRLSSSPRLGGDVTIVGRCPPDSLLAAGTLARAASPDSVVWLLTDRRPSPAHFADDRRTFWGATSRHDFTAGVHTLSAFVTDTRTWRSWRVMNAQEFSVPLPSALPKSRALPSAGCDE